ncbi:MAG: pitrilysin family protein [Acidobacteriota bacterium]
MTQPSMPSGIASELLPVPVRVATLDNGLTVGLVTNRQAPIVTTALWYRAGSRDEAAGQGGAAHFLEHMMFKGSGKYGAGEIDRRTQELGGSNNAFTSHDGTAYYFNFARDRWQEALAIEADRMAGLALAEDEVASERQVILEEIAMYEDDPWDALGRQVEWAMFPRHPYGLPVLGSREELLAMGREELAAFHRAYYRPDNAVLVLAGDLPEDALEAVEESFGHLAAGAKKRRATDPAIALERRYEVERRHGEVERLLVAFRSPAAGHPDHPPLRLLATVLASGRASRLQRALVDEGQLCSAVQVDLGETLDPGHFQISAEVVPGRSIEQVEAVLFEQLDAVISATGVSDEELERARRMVRSDWVFSHERVHQQALAAGFELALFERGFLERQVAALLAADATRLRQVAGRYLDPSGGCVVGRSRAAEAA